MKIQDIKSTRIDNDIIWLGKDSIYVIEKKKLPIQKFQSKIIMNELNKYILDNATTLPNKYMIFQHKMRMEYMKFNYGTLYIQGHLKRNFMGKPIYWQMEFYFDGNIRRLSYEEYLNVKISEKMGFRYIYEKEKNSEETYTLLHNGMVILAGEFIEYRNTNISRFREKYILHYDKLKKKHKYKCIKIKE